MKKTKIYLYQDDFSVEVDTLSPSIWQEREQESLNFYLRFLQPRALVFDVGAHIGGKTDFFLNCQSKVICFEPLPDCSHHLRLKYFHQNDVQIEQVGLGESEGNLELMICSGAPTISTFSRDWVTKSRFAEQGYLWDQKIMVPVTTLDRMIEKYGVPIFCKIDAENYELEILRGLHQKISYLSFEITEETHEKTSLCLQTLSDLGYREFNFAPGDRGLFLSPSWVDAETLLAQLQDAIQTIDFGVLGKMYGDIYARYVIKER